MKYRITFVLDIPSTNREEVEEFIKARIGLPTKMKAEDPLAMLSISCFEADETVFVRRARG